MSVRIPKVNPTACRAGKLTLPDGTALKMTMGLAPGPFQVVTPVAYPTALLRPAMRAFLGPLDAAALTYTWTHPDPRMDVLQRDVMAIVERAAEEKADPETTFLSVRAAAYRTAARGAPLAPTWTVPRPRPPRLTEPWFC